MRLFTAIELEEAVRLQVAALATELQRRVQTSAPRARLTWVAADRLHLTLRFIGEVERDLAERIIHVLREPLGEPEFDLTLDALGAFPRKGPPRVLWVGVADGRDIVIRAEAAISARLSTLGIRAEDRPYSPHLTLARVRDPAGLRASALFEGMTVRTGRTRVETITLFQSHLSPKGPTYTVLEKIRLQRTT